MAMLIQLTANVHRDTQQRLQPFELDEVLGWLGYPPEVEPTLPPRPSPEALYEKAQALQYLFPSSGLSSFPPPGD